MTRDELETLKSIRLPETSTLNADEATREGEAIRAAVALISRLPTFADGAPMVTPCEAWIVAGDWPGMCRTGSLHIIKVRILNSDTLGDRPCHRVYVDGFSGFGFGPVYQTEQAAREASK